MKRKLIKVLLLLFVLLLIPSTFYFLLKQYRKAKQNIYISETNHIPAIYCIGDSLTHGTEGDDYSYPYLLWKDLERDGIYVPVYNYGVGGENVPTICGRVGSMPYLVKEFTIPSKSESVEIYFADDSIRPLLQGGEGQINPCTISGVEGEITYNDDKYYFTRLEEGKDVKVQANEIIETYVTHQIKNDKGAIFVIFIGENGGYEDIDELIDYQKSIIDMCNDNNQKYIIVGLTSGSAADREDLESCMREEYGDKYLNLREYLITEGIDSLVKEKKLTLTETDIEQISKGIVPDSLRTDSVHFTKEGYALVEEAIYSKLCELGYFSDIRDQVKDFNSTWWFAIKIEQLRQKIN